MKNILSIILCAYVFLLFGCDKEIVQKRCDPIPLVDGFRTIKVKEGNWTLKLPEYVNFNQGYTKQKSDCRYADSFVANYVWYKNKLMSKDAYGEKTLEEYVPVKVYSNNLGVIDGAELEVQEWKFKNRIKHNKYPLIFLPEYYSNNPASESSEFHKKASSSYMFEIADTVRKMPNNNPFRAWCTFNFKNSNSIDEVVNSEFMAYGDSKCRGWVVVHKNNKRIDVTVEVWAYLSKPELKGIQDINKIYDALAEELNSYIQE